jgi:glycosyltransferase involved in cell wall biosynthesis
MKKLIIIGPVSEMSDNIFLSKLAQLVKNMSLSIEFWGWERKPASHQCNDSQDNISKRVLLRGGGEANRKLIIWYPLWMIKVFLTTLFLKEDANYLCFNFNTALPVATASFFKNKCFLFANRDNISKSYNWHKSIKVILEYLENFTAKRAKIHLIPGESRWSGKEDNIRVVRNTPSFDTVSKAKQIAKERDYQRGEKFTIYVNGWLTRTRGIVTLLNAVKECRNTINLLVAGVPNCDEAKELINLENVELFGRISPEEALALYYKSHLAFTFYDPKIEINRCAEPNKWGDSIVTGTPFVTNSGIITAQEFINKNACFMVDYEDWQGLANLFNKLSINRDDWREVQSNLEAFEVICWDKAMQKILEEFCNE